VTKRMQFNFRRKREMKKVLPIYRLEGRFVFCLQCIKFICNTWIGRLQPRCRFRQVGLMIYYRYVLYLSCSIVNLKNRAIIQDNIDIRKEYIYIYIYIRKIRVYVYIYIYIRERLKRNKTSEHMKFVWR